MKLLFIPDHYKLPKCLIHNDLYKIITHFSETALDDTQFDYVIENNGTIEELVEKVKIILNKI